LLDSPDLSEVSFDDHELAVMLDRTLVQSAALRARQRHHGLITSGVIAVVLALVAVVLTVSSPDSAGSKAGSSERPTGWILVSDLSALWRTIPVGTANFYLACPSKATCITEGWAGTKSVVDVTHDGGATWTAASLKDDINPPFGCAGSTVCAAAGSSHGKWSLVETTDAGMTWRTEPLPSGLRGAVASCANAGVCAVIGTDRSGAAEAFSTANGGRTWQRSILPPQISVLKAAEVLDVQCFAARTCVALGADEPAKGSTQSAVGLYSTDGGASWNAGATPAAFEPGYNFSCGSASDCVAIGTDAQSKTGAALATENGGRTWVSVSVPPSTSSETQFFNWVSCAGASLCWVTGVRLPKVPGGPASNAVLASTGDLGRTWQETSLPRGVDALGILSCPDGSTCYALGAKTTREGRIETVLLTNHR
jgi:hypothetical protein